MQDNKWFINSNNFLPILFIKCFRIGNVCSMKSIFSQKIVLRLIFHGYFNCRVVN